MTSLSDIRDTHNAFNREVIAPFLLRVMTGVFYLYPLNLLSFLGIITNVRLLIEKQIWIVILASFMAITPSLMGVGMSRYWIMFYTPYLIFASKFISDTFQIAYKNQSRLTKHN